MMVDGCKIPVVGSSDAHTTVNKIPTDKFNNQFTIVFAKDFNSIPNAIVEERSVAISRTDDTFFHVVGKFRYGKYARFLLKEYYPIYNELCKQHGEALEIKDVNKIKEIETKINNFKNKFFNI